MAGSWAILENDQGYADRALGSAFSLVREATTDASAATVPNWPDDADSDMANLSMTVTGYKLVFDGTVPPTSVVVALTDKYGLVVNDDNYTEVVTASKWVKFESPVTIAGGLYGVFTCVGNSKKFKLIIDGLR